MKILMVSSCFPPSIGGIETCAFELSTRLAKRGDTVKIITSSRGMRPGVYHQFLCQGVEVYRYPERCTIIETPIVPGIPLKILLEHRPDVYHIHGTTPTQTDLALLFSKLHGGATVLTHHYDPQTRGGRLTSLYGLLASEVFSLADAIVASTRSYASSSKILKRFLSKTRIIPMGVDTRRFDTRQVRNSNFYEDMFAMYEHKVLYVGKLIYYKGVEYLITAFSKLCLEDSCLIIVGNGADRRNLEQLSKRLGIGDRVHFLGIVPSEELPSIYSAADILVLPSVNRREAFGIVLLEAMSMEKPVVASNIAGVREVVDNQVTGILIPPGDIEAMRTAIDNVLSDQQLHFRLGANARSHVVNRFDWDVVVDKYRELYQDIMC